MPSTGRPSATNLVGNEAGNSREGRGNGSVVDLNGVRPTSAGSTTSAPSQHTPGNYPPGTPVDLQLQQQVSMNPMPKLFLPSTPFDDDNMDPTMDDGDDFSKTPQRGNPLLAAMAAQQRAQATPVPSAPLIIEDDVLEADVDDDVDVNLEDQDDDIMPLDDGGMETEQMEIEPLNEDEAEELKMEAADRVLSGEASGNATVRDMQEAINVSHPFGLKIWKPALYKKDRSINAITYSDLHSVPGRPKENTSTVFFPGNIIWVFLFGWWMALSYVAVAILIIAPISFVGKSSSWLLFILYRILFPCKPSSEIYDSIVIGPLARFARELGRIWQYGRVLLNLSGYIFWPFGKFIAKRRIHVSLYNPKLPGGADDQDAEGNLRNDEIYNSETTPLLSSDIHTPIEVHVSIDAPTPELSGEARYLSAKASKPVRRTSTPYRRVSTTNDNEDLEGLTSDEEDMNDSMENPAGPAYTGENAFWGTPRRRPDANIPESENLTSWQRRIKRIKSGGFAGFVFSVVMFFTLTPLHLVVTGCCFFAVVSVPMAKLNYVLLRHLMRHPLRLSAHSPEEHWANVQRSRNVDLRRQGGISERAEQAGHSRMSSGFDYDSDNEDIRNIARDNCGEGASSGTTVSPPPGMMNSILMSPGTPPILQPTGGSNGLQTKRSDGNVRGHGQKADASLKIMRPVSVFVDTGAAAATQRGHQNDENWEFETSDYLIVLCTYNAIGLKYYKYTVDGVNIMFINLMAVVIFTLFDFYYLGPLLNHKGIGSYTVIFCCALLSVIPLSYFIGMAVSSITAETGSLALGAVINATFGSIVEVILYCLALMEGKTRMVEGAIVGSYMAGLLALPGVSMFFGGLKKKEQKFNSKAATVTSTMLIMSVIGVFGPTLFQEVYGTFELQCLECPVHTSDSSLSPIQAALSCKSCRYHQPAPTLDPIYQRYTRPLMYGSATALVLVYGIGLWFTLRTHAKRIYKTKKKHRRTIRIIDWNGEEVHDDQDVYRNSQPGFAHKDGHTPLLTSLDRPVSADFSGLRSRKPHHRNSMSALKNTWNSPSSSPRTRVSHTPSSGLGKAHVSPVRGNGANLPPMPPSALLTSVHGLGIIEDGHSSFQQAPKAHPGVSHHSIARPRLNIAIPSSGQDRGQRFRNSSMTHSSNRALVDDFVSGDSTSSSSDSESDLLSATDSLAPISNRASILGHSGAASGMQTTNSAVAAYNKGLIAGQASQQRGVSSPSSRARAVSLQLPLGGGASGQPNEVPRHAPSRTENNAEPVKPTSTSSHRDGGHGGHGGHDNPNWNSTKSTIVLLGATVMFSLIAEVLIDAVDHVLPTGNTGGEGGWAIDEKFLGLTLFAIVPTVTEFYNAIAFAQQGNIALSLEIGSAYTIQVALLQIPILVAFSAYWRIFGGGHSKRPKPPHTGGSDFDPIMFIEPEHRLPFQMIEKMMAPMWDAIVTHLSGSIVSAMQNETTPNPPVQDAFSLVFPRWDLVAVLFSVFTVTYLYIEGKSNYFKGAMLLLAYFVLMLAFFCSPPSMSSDT